MLRQELADVRLWFPRCSSVHTCFMRAAIDLVFLDTERVVVSVRPGAKPWRVYWGGSKADSVLELGAGLTQTHGISEDDRLAWPD